MKKVFFLLVLVVTLGSCKSAKKTKNIKDSNIEVTTKKSETNSSDSIYDTEAKTSTTKAEDIVKFAIQFKGVRYKWGGTTKTGMDCSGLVYESFRAHHIYLPRISRDMAKKGKKIKLKEVQEGDLLFFKTKNRRNTINHVGLVTKSTNKVLEFIHATTKKGVIISQLSEDYWYKSFVEARRIL
ncbi:C40 family peptidase [Seonamhaeicola aphaedonensis]|uniref:NlpC/P60 family protein n=1 Tax=Seonamhaeicola aphaedonensis TaxID=1461338 RepID=A0A3D9HL29_9FLAO|nr:C40 family peptidase [Seonamhaeicola aphaedonensis]RED50190.1 NlpC/P60 family protein [Seonamhaeicola aphaedonensis]